ncbi:TlpA family protein disulfide reductase [Chryseobacterium polytrichastri]|uniref:Thioredoxin-like n=1 Tax=Chryseobacterium polytrichastri TaxID=1302687 RepID=A0A1M7K0G6_9FLAO|nr:TlpA disulfide reductase family protein [Chryseobacterium polytrichastri]SHM58822.1 Thioredoxin-like [Chryseobacterium polytrichastri]
MKAVYILFLTGICSYNSCFGQSGNALINGSFKFLNEGDTVTLELVNNPLKIDQPAEAAIISIVHQHRFSFTVPLETPASYISLKLPLKNKNVEGKKNLYDFIVEQNDKIIYTDEIEKEIAGKGACKWVLQRALYKISQSRYDVSPDNKDPDKIITSMKFTDSLFTLKSKLLTAYRDRISSRAFQLIAGSNLSTAWTAKEFVLRNSRIDKNDLAEALSGYLPPDMNAFPAVRDNFTLVLSAGFCEGITARYVVDSCYKSGKPFSVGKCYYFLKAAFSGPAREKLLSYLLYRYRKSADDMRNIVNDADNVIKEPIYRDIIASLKENLLIGRAAYNFNLQDTSGRIIQSADFKEKTVLLDFWFTGCTPCKMLAVKLKEIESKLNHDSMVFISINIDKNRGMWKSSVRSGLYTSLHAVNLNTGALGIGHPLLKHYSVTSFPALLVVDKEGHPKRNPKDPSSDNSEDLLSLLQ